MIPLRRRILLQGMKLFDIFVMIFCFILASSIQSNIEHITLEKFLSMRIKLGNLLLFSGFVCIWQIVFESFGVYESKRLSQFKTVVVEILKATSLGTALFIMIALLFHIKLASRDFILFFGLAVSGLTIASRLVLRFFLGKLRLHGRNLRHMILVGTNPRAIAFAKRIETNNELGYRLIGFADDHWSQLTEVQRSGYPIVSGLREFPAYLRKNIVDEVMICLPIKSLYQEASEIVAACEEQGVVVRFCPDFFNPKLAQTKTLADDGEPIITLFTGSMIGYPLLIKRGIDIIVSLVLIISLLPVFMIVALLIKLTSPGPIFYIQKRLGRNKRIFGVYKFRTMVPDAEKKQAELEHLNEVQGAAFKITDDPRITSIGKYLRKTSLDELPQLLNVLKGDMSLVGPRPLPVRDYEGFDQDWHRRRFSVTPGITCLWQISGRSGISFDKWMELDMNYIDNWSLWLDLKILLGTIPAVIKGTGAA